jgi:Ti-type conjugative transfer relaxase TraA
MVTKRSGVRTYMSLATLVGEEQTRKTAMAIYHFTAKVISRSKGRSAVAAAAYRSASQLHDYRQDLTFDYAAKPDVVHSEILSPRATPEWVHNRELLWNAVEAGEKRRDSQVAREVEFALPEELRQSESIALAREFVEREFVARGMVADLNVHWDQGNPHAHVMLTMRELAPDGFGLKATEWNRHELLEEWREHWADLANQHLLRAGFDIRIDHRSYREQGIELEPTSHLGRAVDEMRARGEQPERFRQLEEVRERNARKIEQRPEIVFDNLTRRQSTFTRRDIAREVFRYVDDGECFRNLMTRLEGSPELMVLVPEGRAGNAVGDARYTTKAMLRVEERLAELAFEMAATDHHPVTDAAVASSVSRHGELSSEQQEALRQMTSPRGIEAVAGFAGTGKSAAVEAARDAWEASGYRVHGAALSGIAAENLEKSSGVESRTLASWELAWKNGKGEISGRDVFVIDEAGMVGSRQMARVLFKLHEAGAKAVLMGDSEQLQPIEAGAAFRAIAERTGYQELTGIRRQQAPWQREASHDFAKGDVSRALGRYREHDAIRFAATRASAKDHLIRDWADQRGVRSEKSSLVLAHTRADVADLNQRARTLLKQRGELEREVKVETSREVAREDGSIALERSERALAPGDRVMFLKNDRGLGVKNGSLGTVMAVSPDSMRVTLDGPQQREVAFNFQDYGSVEYGYAATVHKAQGATVDRAFMLATPGMDRHLVYVGMTRHREEATLYAAHNDFKNFEALRQHLSRPRPKDTTLNYAQRRGLEPIAKPGHKPTEQEPSPKKEPDVAPIEHFKQAQREFIKVAGKFDLDRDAKVRGAQLRQAMKSAAEEISRSAGLMREAERVGIAGQVKSLAREKESALSKDEGFEIER